MSFVVLFSGGLLFFLVLSFMDVLFVLTGFLVVCPKQNIFRFLALLLVFL